MYRLFNQAGDASGWDWISEGIFPPRFQIKGRGRGRFRCGTIISRGFHIKSAYRYLPIYVCVVYKDFPMNSTDRYRYLRPRISQGCVPLPGMVGYGASVPLFRRGT
jgi:hypothetical protein